MKPKLIKDLGQQSVGNQGYKIRKGLYECPGCKSHWIVVTSEVDRGKCTKCKTCRLLHASKKLTTHGLSNNRIYNIYNGIKRRCYYHGHPQYNDYGGRGIIMCETWKLDFMEFYKWAIANGYSDDLTIERNDNNGNYSPVNCSFETRSVQNINQRIRKDIRLVIEVLEKQKMENLKLTYLIKKLKNTSVHSQQRYWRPLFVINT